MRATQLHTFTIGNLHNRGPAALLPDYVTTQRLKEAITPSKLT
jgi:hypothetical protein